MSVMDVGDDLLSPMSEDWCQPRSGCHQNHFAQHKYLTRNSFDFILNNFDLICTLSGSNMPLIFRRGYWLTNQSANCAWVETLTKTEVQTLREWRSKKSRSIVKYFISRKREIFYGFSFWCSLESALSQSNERPQNKPMKERSRSISLKTSLKQRHGGEILSRQIQPILLIPDNLENKYQKVQ